MVRISEDQLRLLSKDELIVLIMKLFDEIDLLKIRMVDLEEKLNQKVSPENQKREIPSWVKMNVKSKKKKSRKKRLNAFVRLKDTPTNTVFHSHEKCPKL